MAVHPRLPPQWRQVVGIWSSLASIGAQTDAFCFSSRALSLQPVFQLIDGQHPSTLAWLLKEKVLPPLYWKGMLKGKEWLAKPKAAKPEIVN